MESIIENANKAIKELSMMKENVPNLDLIEKSRICKVVFGMKDDLGMV